MLNRIELVDELKATRSELIKKLNDHKLVISTIQSEIINLEQAMAVLANQKVKNPTDYPSVGTWKEKIEYALSTLGKGTTNDIKKFLFKKELRVQTQKDKSILKNNIDNNVRTILSKMKIEGIVKVKKDQVFGNLYYL